MLSLVCLPCGVRPVAFLVEALLSVGHTCSMADSPDFVSQAAESGSFTLSTKTGGKLDFYLGPANAFVGFILL